MDGAQAFTLTMCSERVRLADATWRRMSYVPSAIRIQRAWAERDAARVGAALTPRQEPRTHAGAQYVSTSVEGITRCA